MGAHAASSRSTLAWYPSHAPSTPTRMQAGPAVAADGSHRNMCNTISIFTTSRGNICNIHPKQLKHLQHASETLAKHQRKLENHVCSHCKHLDETTCYIRMKTFETLVYIYIYNIQIYFCNIQINHLQHTSKTDKIFRTYT